jgi:DNA polymerase-3 subunit delta
VKLAPRDARAFFARPDPARAGVLLYGPDPMRIALKRQDLVAALIGPQGEAEMRLTRIDAADLRRDPAALQDALKATGFFPGPRAVLLEEAGDAAAPVVADALGAWGPGDAMLVVTAGALPPKSKLRVLFEQHRTALAAAIYDDPPGREEIEAELRRAGLDRIGPAALGELETLARMLEPGDFRQTLDKIALYKLGDPAPLTPEEVLALAPATVEADLDELIHAVAEQQVGAIGPLMQRISGQGTAPVGLVLAAQRHFRALHAAATDPEGPAQGIARARPPVLWKSRDRMARQAQAWGRDRLEPALAALLDTDLALRSAGQTAPQMALVERCLIRLATLLRGR